MHELPVAAAAIRAALTSAQARVGLLFGSEKTGLSNEELSHCDWLLTIPMHPGEGRHPSMNLGQAAAVCLFELVREGTLPSGPAAEPGEATAGDLERLTSLLLEVLEQTGYSRRHPANCDPAQVRRLARRMALEAKDAAVWMGILRQVLWKMGSGEDRS